MPPAGHPPPDKLPTPPSPQPAPHAPAPHAPLAGAVRVVSSLTLLSRVAGLARDVLTARLFGDTLLGSSFRAAYAVPNLFRRLFGEGALSAAFLPEYSLLARDDPAKADQLASLVVRLLTLVTASLTVVLVGVLALVLALAPHDAERSLSFRLMILMLPMMPCVCITAVLGGMLQSHGRFAPTAAAPVLLNLFQIVAGALCLLGVVKDPVTGAYVVGAAALAASVVQIAWSLAALRGKVRWTRLTAGARAHARDVMRRFVPALLGLGTLQLNTMLDVVIAMWPVWVGPTVLGFRVPLDDTSNAILSYAQTLYQFPLGVFGIAVATAVFPLLSRTADRPADFLAHLRQGLRLSLFIGLPASVGLVLVRHDLLAVIFGGGRHAAFSPEGLARAGDVLLGFAPAIWAYSLNHVLTRAFYAQRDTTTPMRLAVRMVALNVTLNLTLIWFLGEAGLAWSTAIAASVQCLALWRLAHTRLGLRPLDAPTRAAFARIAGATAAMTGGVALVLWLLPPADTWAGHALRLTACLVAGIGVYAGAARLARLPELGMLLRRPRAGPAGPVSFD
ncbi:MAG: murein biosynthesis integral membrane protein MurJ [Planctomycetota bacterium]|nr:murein biosynthesis integral membrane protein MurJ [Planctomycetota bacterium]